MRPCWRSASAMKRSVPATSPDPPPDRAAWGGAAGAGAAPATRPAMASIVNALIVIAPSPLTAALDEKRGRRTNDRRYAYPGTRLAPAGLVNAARGGPAGVPPPRRAASRAGRGTRARVLPNY